MNHLANVKTESNNITRIDLNSEIWGPAGWFFSESICLAYPKNPSMEEKIQYKNYFYSFPYVVPCNKCRYHFLQYINKYPLTDNILSSRLKMIIWILGAHNNVNRMNNKNNITLDKFNKYYNDKYKMDVNNDTCKIKCGLNLNSKPAKKTCDISNSNSNANNPFVFLIILFGIMTILMFFMHKKH